MSRDLQRSEKRLSPFSSEKKRDRANAQRAIEGLSQGDAQIALLSQISAQLAWISEEMVRQRPAQAVASEAPPEAVTVSAGA